MLDEYKQNYEQIANCLPNWKNISKSELCRQYCKCVDTNDPKSELYLAAIIYRFWNLLTRDYYNQQIKLADEYDCYNWFIESILYVLEKRVWEDKNSTLYKDINGPEKAIATVMNSQKINYFVANKRDKRRIDNESLSLDQLMEDSSDGYYIPYFDENNIFDEYLKAKIKKCFEEKKYFMAFGLDIIVNGDVYERTEESDTYNISFSKKKFKHLLGMIDEDYCLYFSNRYDIDKQSVIENSNYVKNIYTYDVYDSLRRMFYELTTDRDFMMRLR